MRYNLLLELARLKPQLYLMAIAPGRPPWETVIKAYSEARGLEREVARITLQTSYRSLKGRVVTKRRSLGKVVLTPAGSWRLYLIEVGRFD
ncbi:hypothetical protein [Clavavirus yamagawaense]|uniref:Uncharacterized protein n=1 Tax=Aeropyrum pernix bacilliform virus 1 (isolate -/Japan/Tanaka/2005) TaxID=1289471 RepID=D4QF77_APBV1|nr:hypothetical protein FK791_gp11 [Aeropyrum pernix bacilliform virus 1]BAJ06121.1 hypothetical protein [Aeropyrum pernix bacilliform virus 1]